MYTKDELVNLIHTNPQKFSEIKPELGEEFDLSESEFHGLTLENIDFSGADLSGSNFSETHLSEVNFSNCDLTSADFTRSQIVESDFSNSILNGGDFSYATVSYSNFTDADMAGSILNCAILDNTDFAGSNNMSACRFDSETVFPDSDMLPEDFDSNYQEDLSLLKDDEDEAGANFEY